MQIVIDIPQGLKIDFENENWTALTCAEMKNALMRGTPLPKRHGRLIDADELTKQLETVANDEWNKQVGASKGLEDAIDIVDNEQTIIEKEGE